MRASCVNCVVMVQEKVQNEEVPAVLLFVRSGIVYWMNFFVWRREKVHNQEVPSILYIHRGVVVYLDEFPCMGGGKKCTIKNFLLFCLSNAVWLCI